MPRKVCPPCGYIREVCYNDCAPQIRHRTRKKSAPENAESLSAAARPAQATAETPAVCRGETQVNPSLIAGLLLALLLS